MIDARTTGKKLTCLTVAAALMALPMTVGVGLVASEAAFAASSASVSPSDLGVLNAINASPTAFASASPKSRLGRIKAYYDANLEAEQASAIADITDAAALEAVYNDLVASGADQATIDAAIGAWQDAVADDAAAAAAAETADAALAAATNKEVTPELKALVDAVLDGKI